jgi:hypothetical protein
MRPRDQPPEHWPEVRRLIERMSAEDLRAFFIQRIDRLVHLRCGFLHLADSFANEQEILGIDVACLYDSWAEQERRFGLLLAAVNSCF